MLVQCVDSRLRGNDSGGVGVDTRLGGNDNLVKNDANRQKGANYFNHCH